MFKKRRMSLLQKIFWIICGLYLVEGTSIGQEEKFKALFIYNFTKYIQWPGNIEGDFKIVVIGSNTMVNELNIIASKKTVGQSTISVESAKSASSVKQCQIAFISHENMDQLSELVEKAKHSNILIITESPKSCLQGACLNFVSMSGSIKFEISKTNIESYGLKISAALMNLGIIVN